MSILYLSWVLPCRSQNSIDSFRMSGDVKITIDHPLEKKSIKESILIIYALPNGNTTEQTMGKKIQNGDDWHFDIQHIRAQTEFIREKIHKNITIAYVENSYRSWPLWKQKNDDYKIKILHIVDTLSSFISDGKTSIYLNGHSGGGSFIFGYLDAVDHIPKMIQRISFLDSDYGYDSIYYQKFRNWLQTNRSAVLTVFAYNDSVALYNGKPVVSQKGGTWYRSGLMLRQLEQDFKFEKLKDDSLVIYTSKNKRIGFFLKTNPEQKIFHTQQVELNGFIHSILFGTKHESKGYQYFGPRAYGRFIN
ncbi:MAG: hypothetical protein ACJ749_07275 [Flavisolibacter sp.]